MKTRQAWIDIVKGMAIVAIVAYHTFYCFPKYEIIEGHNLIPVRDFFGKMWHVPVFLMIGGFFMEQEELVHPIPFIKKKFKALYLKLFIFYALFILLHNLFFKVGLLDTTELYGGKHIYPLLTVTDYIKQFAWATVAAREPFLGATWFINLMFVGFCVLSITAWLLSKSKKIPLNEYSLGAAVVVIAVCSCIVSHGYGIMIPRLSSALCVPMLLYAGFLMNRKYKWNFDNTYVFIASLFIVYEICMLYGDVSLACTKYADTLNLLFGTIASTYALCYIAKKIENSIVGKMFAQCGVHSYYIMVWHLLGFKIATAILWCCGIPKSWTILFSPAKTVYELLLYIIVGILSLFVLRSWLFLSRSESVENPSNSALT